MKRWIHAAEGGKRLFKYPDDILEIENYVADNYNPASFTCVDVCNYLESKYSNLKSVPISSMWIDDHFETNHQVCLVQGDAGHGCNLIDPTGDQFLGKTKGMKCAAFHQTKFGYYSKDYQPAHASSDDYMYLLEQMRDIVSDCRLIEL